jgi:two-component system sensor histidine kinase FlrB
VIRPRTTPERRPRQAPAGREEAAPAPIERLTQAFTAFTAATSTLEGAYRVLQDRVAAMTAELEEKNALLQQSLARQRDLEAEAVRHSRLAAMGEMAATLAHEVRNPLGSMELFAALLRDDLEDRPAARHLVSQISEGIKDLNHLVSNILGFTRCPQPERAAVDVVAAIEDALRYSTVLLAENRVGIVRCYDAGPREAMGDGGLVRQIFLNLIRNAAQAMEGGGTLTVRVHRGEWLAVSFADTGGGIPRDARQRIFDPFFTTKERGTGLGLAVVRALVEALGGEVVQHGEEGGGACFTVRLRPRDTCGAERGVEEAARTEPA